MATGTRGLITTAAGMGVMAVVALGTAGLSSCDDKAKGTQNTTADPKKDEKKNDTRDEAKDTKAYEEVTIGGKEFKLELALDPTTRFKGLTGRTEIPEDGGMLFVFPRPITTAFVMRDCPVPIDIIYLDATGRVGKFYKMTVDPRNDDEHEVTDPETGTNEKYENRLKKYPSEYDAQFVIELKGNTLDGLNIKKGDKIKLALDKLKKQAK